MKKEIKDANHHMGKQTGYTLIDGAYHVAPMYQQDFAKFKDKYVAISEYIKAVTTHVMSLNEEIARQERETWKLISEDLGLDTNKQWQYNFDTETITEQKPPKEANK